MKLARTREEIASIIERFVQGTAAPYEWDDFCSLEISNTYLDRIREICCNVDRRFPTSNMRQYTSEFGAAFLLRVARALRERSEEDALRFVEKESAS